MDLFSVVAEQLFASLRESKKDTPKKDDGTDATKEAITKRYEDMLNEVVNDGSSASGGSKSGLSRRLEHLNVADSSDAASAILSSESLLGQMDGNDDWEVKLREKLAPETKKKYRSKKECVSRAERLGVEMGREGTLLVPGEKPYGKNKHIRQNKLPQCFPPQQLLNLVLHEGTSVEIQYPVMKEQLNVNNYERKLSLLLMIDEVESVINMRQYDLDGVTLSRSGHGCLSLQVPGLADGRPSLMPGDSIHLWQIGRSQVYQGYIHYVQKDEVLLKFHPEFHVNYNDESYNVTFKESRTQIRRCHWAVEQGKLLSPAVLFPVNGIQLQTPLVTVTVNSVKWINKSLNERQRNAVVNVLRSECRPSPYVIFGPPGTGKTMTIVECILQVFKHFPRSRILACSGSNACADLIGTKLLESGMVDSSNMIRVIAHNRLDRIPDNLKEYSKTADEDTKTWLYHRIIIATCSNVGAIIDYKPRKGHFTHTFIDEAAQATEPESLLSIIQSAQDGGSTILAGDPFQLGPVIQSKIGKAHGLGIPLMSRLCEMKPYQREKEMYKECGHYDPRCITKLVESYRCCGELIHINSKLFYHSELVCQLDRDESLLKKINAKFPVIFDAVQGMDIQEPDNPSWCNLAEVLTCTKYLLQLYQAGLKEDDIGIITPYRKQAEKIRRFVESLGRPVCKIATIEEFQGGERKVIIVSMVRSSAKNLSHDLKFGLGFIFNDKRFNVATSRAKSLLIVIGDPNLLMRDECWKMFISYCKMNQSTAGIPFNIPQQMPHSLEDLLQETDDDGEDDDSMFDSPPDE